MLSFQLNSRWWEVRYLEMWCLQPAGFVRRWLVDMKFGPFCFGWWHLERTKFANTSFSGFLSSGGDGGRRRLVGCVRRKFAWIRRADLVLVAQWTLVVQTDGHRTLSTCPPPPLLLSTMRLSACFETHRRHLCAGLIGFGMILLHWFPQWVATGNLAQISFPRLQNRNHDQM